MCEHEGKPCPGRSCRCVCDNCVLGDGDEETFEVHEKTYSWGTVVSVYRGGRRTMFVDVYNTGKYAVYAESSW
jgi:hypothetical protein